MASQAESLWVIILASKCKDFICQNYYPFIFLIVFICFSWLTLSFLYWTFPGGPAWGKHYFWSKYYSNPIPGPRGFPVVGSMNLMADLAHQHLEAMAKVLKAKRVMALSIGETRLIVTSDPDVAKEILNSCVFSDRPVKETAYSLMFNRAIGFAPYGVYWRTLRRIAATHIFCPKQMIISEAQRSRIATQIVREIGRQSKEAIGKCFEIRKLLKRASLCNMMSLVFGRDYVVEELSCTNNSEASELSRLVEEGYDLLGQLNWSDHLPWISSFDPQNIRVRCSKLVPQVYRLVTRIISEHRASALKKLPTETSRAFVDVLFAQHLNNLSEADMVAVLWEMIFRGTDTVAVIIEWILARMVLHPTIQAKVHEELNRVVGQSRAITESDVSALVYLRAVVNEAFRLHPPGPLLSWARLATTDTTIDGYHVPAGTTAMVNMWAITRDPSVWTDPLSFTPERFMTKHSPDDEFSMMGSDLRLAPFGSGIRICPGRFLGLTTVTFWVASILHKFEILQSDHNPVDLSEVLRLSCEMANPFVAKFLPRRRYVSHW
ncbi:Cytochrome P450, family 78, subfamily A, polypeptide 6 [Heracleum sosnowskyi]|uniref:Cytochrome P450, family 78, subfamily A, polypeptide 6 n=1 Tax=Heracleum sosnowskyi TaxID=360622 RepID=A0AAD8IB21_9APIA|nr:Cytochrome P450, family 78, subfamily A, polypeptide 6 [Heracleum sosnowskyi]